MIAPDTAPAALRRAAGELAEHDGLDQMRAALIDVAIASETAAPYSTATASVSDASLDAANKAIRTRFGRALAEIATATRLGAPEELAARAVALSVSVGGDSGALLAAMRESRGSAYRMEVTAACRRAELRRDDVRALAREIADTADALESGD